MSKTYRETKPRRDCEQRLLGDLNNRFSRIFAGFSGAIAEWGNSPTSDCVNERARVIASKMMAMAALHGALSAAPPVGESLEHYCRSLCVAILTATDRTDVHVAAIMDDVRLSPQKELRLGHLVCELVTAALEDCPANGVIRIELRHCDSRLLTLSVRSSRGVRPCAPIHRPALCDLVECLGGRQISAVGSACGVQIQIPL